jgi:hypothetical protein
MGQSNDDIDWQAVDTGVGGAAIVLLTVLMAAIAKHQIRSKVSRYEPDKVTFVWRRWFCQPPVPQIHAIDCGAAVLVAALLNATQDAARVHGKCGNERSGHQTQY